LGLLPPVSGHYNNWFIDCMGAPIRSELWSCLAPGVPSLAVRYAYEDASVDHAGGEGVWGEVFNAAVGAAAFVETDPQALLDVGLSYVPPDSYTARAVRAARQAHRDGVDWKEARERVRLAAPSYVAQYAPPNIGFQVIGWLYGRDFGDALCTAVNCGYDTDCTGATLGALLGILGGRAGLPERWTAPLGDTIATNESSGGLRHASTGPNPVPATLGELTDRVCALGPRLLALRSPVRIGDRAVVGDAAKPSLHAVEADTAWLRDRWPSRLEHRLGAVTVAVDYGDAPVITPGVVKTVAVRVQNVRADDLTLDVSLTPPTGWTVGASADRQLRVAAGAATTLSYAVSAANAAHIENSNRALLSVQPHGRPAESVLPIVLIGARRWLLWGPLAGEDSGDAAAALLDRPYPPEEQAGNDSREARRENGWRVAHADGNALPDEPGADWMGVLYARLYLWSDREREARLGVPATCPRKLWLNGEAAHEVRTPTLLRPNYDGDGVSYVDVALRQGWNEVLIKYARDAATPPFAAHLIVTERGQHPGLTDVTWTRLPWDDNTSS